MKKNNLEIENIVLFESSNVLDFEPFNIMHPIWEIRVGAFRIFEKYAILLNNPDLFFIGRDLQLNSFLKRFNYDNSGFSKKNTLMIDSSIVPDKDLFKSLEKYYNIFLENDTPTKTVIFTNNDIPFALYIPNDELFNTNENDYKFLIRYFSDFINIIPKIEIKEIKKLNFLWDTLDICSDQINEDIHFFNDNHINDFKNDSKISLINEDNVFIGKNVKISPFVVIDASMGSVIISDNVTIMPHSTIIGPIFIGKNTIIKTGAKLYEKTAIGEFCKVGGEIENSIIQSYSNKQHEGFLGHSFICEWVNLGADTNNSDLKNTYGNIKMRLTHKTVDTKRIFLGLLCGDHTKSAINTQFNTGTISGICGVLFESGFLSTTIPSFSWGGLKNSKFNSFDSSIETAKIVLSRRNKVLIEEEIILIQNEYEKVTKI
jgi:UDP-N-acetylglucosamine diphosphorylase/glucosamine-1-phosphate N-acetyltransferase